MRPSAIFGLALANWVGGIAAEEGIAVKGEVSPARATTFSAPALGLERLGALDTALAIALPALGQQQRSAMTEPPGVGPLRIGLHRDLPTEYRGDLTPLLRWVPDPNDGRMVAAVTVTSPGAVRVRLAIRAELPPRARIRFFGGEPPQVVGVIDRTDLAAPAGQAGPELLWSPSVAGDTIGLEIELPSDDLRSETSVVIDRVSHQYRGLDSMQAPSATDEKVAQRQTLSDLNCAHVDIQCREVGRVADAVASITYEKERNQYVCSGTLMNDNDPRSSIPYFLTAHHCVSTQVVASYGRKWCTDELSDAACLC